MMTGKQHEDRWVGTWTATQDAIEKLTLTNQTVRMISYLSLGGTHFRIRIANYCGTDDLAIGAVQLGLRSRDANLVPTSSRVVTFNGLPTTTIPAGASVISDVVTLAVKPLSELAISIYLPGELHENFRLTGLDGCHQTNYISPTGNFVAADDMLVSRSIEAWLFVSAIEVLVPPQTGGIVAFGDSITEGNISTLDANSRWPDQLARRIATRLQGRMLGVVNQGIGGNRLLHDGRGANGLRRFDRDVVAQPNVTHVIIALGVNDLRNSSKRPEQIVSADQLIAGLHQLIIRARAHGIKVLGATITPWEHETFSHLWTPEAEGKRQAVNTWIRESGQFDAVIDFDAVLCDPSHPTRLLPQWDCGDHLHPSDAGYQHMGDSIDLALFD